MEAKAIKEILDTIEDEHLGRLTLWERGFFETCCDTFERYGKISIGQAEKLEQIWHRLP